MKIRTKLASSFGIQVLLTAILGLGVLAGIVSVNNQFGQVVERDAVVIANARHLAKLVVDMETGQRGFCITHREEFLEPYYEGATSFDAVMSEQMKLVSDNPDQVAVLEQVAELVQEWKGKAAGPEIAMARRVATHEIDAEHLQAVLRRGVGRDLMKKVMTVGHEIEAAFSSQEDWESAFVVELIEKCMVDREDGQRGFLITGDERFLDKYLEGEQANLPGYFARLRALVADRGRGDELSAKVDRLESLAQEWTTKAAEPEIAARREMNAHPETLKDVAALLVAGTGKAIIDEIRQKLDAFIDVESKLAASRYQNASNTTALTRNLAVGLLLVAVCAGLFVLVQVSRSIFRPLDKLLLGTEKVGRGDLDTRLQVDSSDEIGDLAGAFNSMTANLQEAESMRQLAKVELDAERGLLRQLIEIQEQERRMVAHDIHDGFVQDVVGAHMQVQPIEDSTDLEQAAQTASNVGSLLQKAITEGRRLIREMRPMILDEEGVVAAIRHLIADEAANSDVLVDFDHDVQFERLEPKFEGVVFRIVQEALTNIRRHSHAQHACVSMMQQNGILELVVRDDRQGFNPDSVAVESFGLRGMRERARLFGGTVRTEGDPGKGTTIHVELPIPEAA